MIRVDRLRLPDFRKSVVNKIRKAAFKTVGLFWHRRLRPKRFTVRGGRELGFAPRSKRYLRLKANKLHHQRPLEFTGRSKAASGAKRVVATKDLVRIIHPLLRAFNYKPRNSKVNMRKEFATIGTQETPQMEHEFAQRYESQVQRQQPTYSAN